MPAGEFYGEFGDFDVTLVVRDDQVIGATGVPVSGDPGWARAAASGARRRGSPAMRRRTCRRPCVSHRLQGIARCASSRATCTTSPGPRRRTFATRARRTCGPDGQWRLPFWDTVAVHALYRVDAERDCRVANDTLANSPKLDSIVGRPVWTAARSQWENGRALQFGLTTLRWLEAVYGDYPIRS